MTIAPGDLAVADETAIGDVVLVGENGRVVMALRGIALKIVKRSEENPVAAGLPGMAG